MDEIYEQYYDKIYNFAIKKTNNKEDALDLTNDVFLAIFEYLGKGIKINKMENLIWKIAYNLWCTKAKFYINEKSNLEFSDIYQENYTTSSLDKIIYKEIVLELDKFGLTEKEIKIFNLYYINDLSIKEISEKLNMKEANIKYYLYNARNKIKERYSE